MVSLTTKETDALKERIEKNNLTEKDCTIILNLLSFNIWLQSRLSRAKLTIKRLRQLFGFKSESHKSSKTNKDTQPSEQEKKNPKQTDEAEPSNDENSTSEPDNTESENKACANTLKKWNPAANHGNYSVADYPGCPEINIPIEEDKLNRKICPECAQANTSAKVYPEKPSVVLLFDSQPLISGKRYNLERVRCSVCQTYFTASLPAALQKSEKYAPSCITSIAIHHYYAGLPFKRIEMLQAAQGVPLADSTQYDLINQFHTSSIKPLIPVLQQSAAQGKSHYYDDSPNKILEQIAYNKQQTNNKDRQAIHSTVILSEYEGHRIYLFQTNTRTAGKELRELFKKRDNDENFITMSDASSHNFPEMDDCLLARWIICLCLAHGRRRFVELLGDINEDSRFVLDIIGQVYHNEAHCKQENFNSEQRLKYHQKNSAPLMESLRIWFNNLLLFKQVEPNSPLGEAIIYMLKRWYWLTQYLRVPGAPLDNNITEQAIKVVIRYSKNSLFYRTFHGANIGDGVMSLLHTAVHNQVNIFDYFNAIQHYKDEVNSSPVDWLPWSYQKTISNLYTPQVVTLNSS
jgi:hypothetical protein